MFKNFAEYNFSFFLQTSDINKDIFTEDDSLEPRHRLLRTNSKILQEKSGNVKVVKEKDAQKKKADIMQATIEENKRY